jgi:hypothetical protein
MSRRVCKSVEARVFPSPSGRSSEPWRGYQRTFEGAGFQGCETLFFVAEYHMQMTPQPAHTKTTVRNSKIFMEKSYIRVLMGAMDSAAGYCGRLVGNWEVKFWVARHSDTKGLLRWLPEKSEDRGRAKGADV